MSFIELRQTGENDWKGKYQGNYGVYTIKVTLNGQKAAKYSCSCPSDSYPCKHIHYIEKAIAEKMAANEKLNKGEVLKLEDLIKTVSAEKLREFILTQAKYNNELFNAVLFEFAANVEDTKGNKYSSVIQRALASVDVDTDDFYYSGEPQSIDVLDQWFEKARDCVGQKQYDEAILICKACIEEYFQWLYNTGEDVDMYYEEYQSTPFDIMEKAAAHVGKADKKKLFDYCLSEMKRKKYKDTGVSYSFHELLESLAVTVNTEAFIALQDELLEELEDRNSNAARTILQRKINLYRRLGQTDKAWALIKKNIQIVLFRKELAEKLIKERNFPEAKKLINDYVTEQARNENHRVSDEWQKLLLEIAQKEKDIPAIRELSYGFIKEFFKQEYYQIYKATFSSAEWAEEMEKLLLNYDDKKHFRSSVADLLAAEKEAKRLLLYLEDHLSLQNLIHYYKVFASAYPEKTLELFRKELVYYAENNMGRSHYEYILSLLKKMSQIEGGKKVTRDLAADFRIRYKNRRAMLEVLGNFK